MPRCSQSVNKPIWQAIRNFYAVNRPRSARARDLHEWPIKIYDPRLQTKRLAVFSLIIASVYARECVSKPARPWHMGRLSESVPYVFSKPCYANQMFVHQIDKHGHIYTCINYRDLAWFPFEISVTSLKLSLSLGKPFNKRLTTISYRLATG